MNWIKRIFQKRTESCAIQNVSYSGADKEESQENLFITKVAELLKEKPEVFSAKWFDGHSMDKSVRSKDKKILIGFDGSILAPIRAEMLKKQRYLLADLIKPIVERDKKELIDRAMSSYS